MTSDLAIVLFAPTQAGKSTLVAFLAEEGVPVPTGDGDGESVTVDTTLYWSPKLGHWLLDVPGINDSMLRFTNQEAGKRVALGVARAGVRRVKFLVLDSLGNDSLQLRNTLVEFVTAFGRPMLPSVVVVPSKADRCPQESMAKRVSTMQEIGRKLGINQVVVWQNSSISYDGKQGQLGELKRALEQTPDGQIHELEDLQTRVQTRAQKLYESAPMQQKQVPVKQEYQEEYQEKEPFEEAYIKWTPGQESYTITVPYQDTVHQQVEYQTLERGPTFGKIISLGMGFQDRLENHTKTVSVPVTKYKEEIRSRAIKVPETAYRTAHRDVTKYTTKTRMVEQTVDYKVPLEQFMDRAMSEIIAEMRATLSSAADGSTEL